MQENSIAVINQDLKKEVDGLDTKIEDLEKEIQSIESKNQETEQLIKETQE